MITVQFWIVFPCFPPVSANFDIFSLHSQPARWSSFINSSSTVLEKTQYAHTSALIFSSGDEMSFFLSLCNGLLFPLVCCCDVQSWKGWSGKTSTTLIRAKYGNDENCQKINKRTIACHKCNHSLSVLRLRERSLHERNSNYSTKKKHIDNWLTYVIVTIISKLNC